MTDIFLPLCQLQPYLYGISNIWKRQERLGWCQTSIAIGTVRFQMSLAGLVTMTVRPN